LGFRLGFNEIVILSTDSVSIAAFRSSSNFFLLFAHLTDKHEKRAAEKPYSAMDGISAMGRNGLVPKIVPI